MHQRNDHLHQYEKESQLAREIARVHLILGRPPRKRTRQDILSNSFLQYERNFAKKMSSSQISHDNKVGAFHPQTLD